MEAARERFRPILMTSFAFIFGVAPLMIASGRRRGQPALARHRRVRRHAHRDHGRHLLHPALLLRSSAGVDRAVDASAPVPAAPRAGRGGSMSRAHAGSRRSLFVAAPARSARRIKSRRWRRPAPRSASRRGRTRSGRSTTRWPRPIPRPAPAPATLQADSADLAWLAVLKDTTLRRSGERARCGRTGTCRPRSRGSGSSGRRSGSPGRSCSPSCRPTARRSTNQVALGAFEPVSFDALRVTADLAVGAGLLGADPARRPGLARRSRGRGGGVPGHGAHPGERRLQRLPRACSSWVRRRRSRSAPSPPGGPRWRWPAKRFESGVISELDVHQFESEVAVPAAALAQARRLRSQREHELAGAGRPACRSTSRPPAALAEAVEAVAGTRLAAGHAAGPPARRARGGAGLRGVGGAGREWRRPPGCRRSASPAITAASRAPRTTSSPATPRSTSSRPGSRSRCSPAAGSPTRLARRAPGRSRPASSSRRRCCRRSARRATRWSAVRTARDQRVAQQSQVVALRKAAQLADIRYRGGVASYLEVLDAQRQLFSAELGLSQTQLLELSSAVGLYRALGGSWAARRE